MYVWNFTDAFCVGVWRRDDHAGREEHHHERHCENQGVRTGHKEPLSRGDGTYSSIARENQADHIRRPRRVHLSACPEEAAAPIAPESKGPTSLAARVRPRNSWALPRGSVDEWIGEEA